ncbi:J-domain-containing protein [Leucobacter chinensis]|uniref:DnaJ family domain-containing protein n=1 Tax=Leucobacter chinensis TaxID=2851010 RepID=UPI001C2508FC|nr:DUF1992 domain-containing protein [Leucobacter chinensis]
MAENELPSSFFNPSAFAFDTETMIALIADMQIRKAIERGEFDNLPGAGKPIDVSDSHDPDWWLKRLARREGLVVLPPSVQLRNEDAALNKKLDQLASEREVRREIEAFNEHVTWARYQLPAGPPLITMPRDLEATVAAWVARKEQSAEQARRKAEESRDNERAQMRRRLGFFRRRRTEQ